MARDAEQTRPRLRCRTSAERHSTPREGQSAASTAFCRSGLSAEDVRPQGGSLPLDPPQENRGPCLAPVGPWVR